MNARLLKMSDQVRAAAAAWPSMTSTPLQWLVLLMVVAGISFRLSPLADVEGRLFWQYMTEDGYLMQTIARNMAIGLGMSTAQGSMPTNGVQPLATYLFAALHLIADGSRTAGIVLVTLLSTLVSIAAAYVLHLVGAKVFAGHRHGQEMATLAAALWFVAPLLVRHSMNGLETGLYYLAILATLNVYLAMTQDDAPPMAWSQRLVLGALLGVAFLARNDAVFFIAGLLLAHLFIGGTHAGGGYGRRFRDCLAAGIVSVVVAVPWLLYNLTQFGSIVPTSGTAQSHQAALGLNLRLIPANLFENAFLFLPLPGRFEAWTPVVLLATVSVVLTWVGFWIFAARLTLPSRRFFVAGLLFTVFLSSYYGIFFGAAWFLPRYTSPLSPFLWLATFACVFFVLKVVGSTRPTFQRLVFSVTALLAVAAGAFAANDFRNGGLHMHRQVVEWVAEHVPEHAWVGAPQTGTLGFFHDRTINLDGKVSPQALQVLIQHGHVLDYVVDSPIDFIVDWVGMADWVDLPHSPRFSQAFEVVVRDEARNLAALRRKEPVSR